MSMLQHISFTNHVLQYAPRERSGPAAGRVPWQTAGFEEVFERSSLEYWEDLERLCEGLRRVSESADRWVVIPGRRLPITLSN